MSDRSQSEMLFGRAQKVIPGGIYGHVSPVAGLPDCFPHYCRKAEGCHFEDVDGKQWMDFMCAYGAVLHGYSNPEIDDAVRSQQASGSVFNLPSAVMVELAEELTQTIDFADWSVFAKNGSDLTTWAIRVARQYTQRPYVIKAKGAYHGVDAWCDPGYGGRIDSDRREVLEFEWNDATELEDLLRKYAGKVACIILTPYHHAAFAPSKLPADGFWQRVRNLCDKYGILLVLDDVRTFGRLSVHGSHRFFGFRPDMAIYSKALGNGYAISTCLGIDALKKASMEVFLTGSCWNDALSMTAALVSLRILKRDNVASEVSNKGALFAKGMENLAKEYDYSLRMTGPTSMPYPWFDGDDDMFLLQRFCRMAAGEGLFFHPHHNWFISNALDNESISHALSLVEKVFERMKEAND